MQVWKTAERWKNGPLKFCKNTPLWNNPKLLCGNQPFYHPSWSSRGINTIGDICNTQGLSSFHDLRSQFSLTSSSYFVYFQLRSALKSWCSLGFPIPSNPMLEWIAPIIGTPSVSIIYMNLTYCNLKPLTVQSIWNKELGDLIIDWDIVWTNINLTSKTLAHQVIHFNAIHRTYITPYKRFQMKLKVV